MRTYPVTYQDKRGTEKAIIKSDGSELYFSLRGIDFEGSDFEALSGIVDHSKFDYELFEDGSGDLTNFKLEVELPILLFDNNKKSTFTEVLHCFIEVGKAIEIQGLDSVINCMTLKTSFGEFTVNKKLEWFETALISLQDQLPEHIYLKTCLSCKYGNYSPYGNGMFGNIYCFKNFREELKQIENKFDMLEIWTPEAVKKGAIFYVQETFDCPEHELPTKKDWYYKDWRKVID